MRLASTRTRTAMVGALSAIVLGIPLATAPANAETAAPEEAVQAAAAQLGGHWAPFSRCPVDDPAMLAADGRTLIPTCVSSYSPSGSIKLGKTTTPTTWTDLQFGVVQNTVEKTFTVVPAPAGSLLAAPAEIPGGLLGLACPPDVPVVTGICELLTDNSLNRVIAKVESAGSPRDYDLTAGYGNGKPIVTLPIRIKLENPFLGDKCYIGSNANPILLKPQNLAFPKVAVQRFDGNGTPNTAGSMLRFALTEKNQGDSTFAVPKASGCGLGGILSGAIDLKTGLPSPSGTNNLLLNNTSTYSGGLTSPASVQPDAGKVLAQNWHSAKIS